MYYIYKYIYQNQVVYVGKTKQLEERIKQHTQETAFFGIKEVYYFECDTKEAMDVNEAYWINFYKPQINSAMPSLNSAYKHLICKEPAWTKYNKSIVCPTPLVYNFKQELEKEGITKGCLFAARPYAGKIQVSEYGGLQFILFDEFNRIYDIIQQNWDDTVGEEAVKIANHFLEGTGKQITYLGNNTWQTSEG